MPNRELEKKKRIARKRSLNAPVRKYDPTVTMQFYQRRVHGETEFQRFLHWRGFWEAELRRLENRLEDLGIKTAGILAHVKFIEGKKYGLWLMFRGDGCSFFLEQNHNIWKISCWYASRDRAKEVYSRAGTQGIRWIDWFDIEANPLQSLMD